MSLRRIYAGPVGAALAVEEDPASDFFGWLFAAHSGGDWVSVAKLDAYAQLKEREAKLAGADQAVAAMRLERDSWRRRVEADEAARRTVEAERDAARATFAAAQAREQALRGALSASIEGHRNMCSYLGHQDQDANHEWMFRKMREYEHAAADALAAKPDDAALREREAAAELRARQDEHRESWAKLAELRAQRDTMLRDRAEALKATERAEAFKRYVHGRLDAAGVPADPEPEANAKHGCRIEGRLNFLERRWRELVGYLGELREGLEQARPYLGIDHASKHADCHACQRTKALDALLERVNAPLLLPPGQAGPKPPTGASGEAIGTSVRTTAPEAAATVLEAAAERAERVLHEHLPYVPRAMIEAMYAAVSGFVELAPGVGARR